MRILFNDRIQHSNAPKELKSPALSQTLPVRGVLSVRLDRESLIDCVGIGNTDGRLFRVNGQEIAFNGNGLYILPRRITAAVLTIETAASHIGRLAAGLAVNIPTSVAKEPAFRSTAEPRITLSGQVVPGLGGYAYRTLSLDSRYKIGREAMSEIEAGYRYIGMGYPFFIDLADEAYKLPFDKLYATDTRQQSLGFESGVRRFLYSRRWEFRECF